MDRFLGLYIPWVLYTGIIWGNSGNTTAIGMVFEGIFAEQIVRRSIEMEPADSLRIHLQFHPG